MSLTPQVTEASTEAARLLAGKCLGILLRHKASEMSLWEGSRGVMGVVKLDEGTRQIPCPELSLDDVRAAFEGNLALNRSKQVPASAIEHDGMLEVGVRLDIDRGGGVFVRPHWSALALRDLGFRVVRF